MAPEITLINLHFTVQPGFRFARAGQCAPNHHVDPLDRVSVQVQLSCGPIGRHLQRKQTDDRSQLTCTEVTVPEEP